MLADTPKETGQTGTSFNISPDLHMHIVNSRWTLHGGTEHSVNGSDCIYRGRNRAIIQIGNWRDITTGN